MGSNDWYHLLATHPDFMAKVAARWSALRSGLFSEAELEARMAALTEPLSNAAARDFERWPVSVASNSFFSIPSGSTWQAQLQAVRDWIPLRLAWLDSAVTRSVEAND
jgi:hypothetical protein